MHTHTPTQEPVLGGEQIDILVDIMGRINFMGSQWDGMDRKVHLFHKKKAIKT